MSQSNASGMTFMEKLSTFIVDKRSLIFLITIIGLLFSAVSRSWVEVENDLTYYLPDDSQTKQALAVMDEEFITYGTAEVMAANVTPAQAEKLAAQIREVEGVQSVDYDKTTDHYNALSALFSVTFAYDEDDDACLTSLEAVKELLSSYDLYISTDLGNTLRETIDHEISIIMIYVAIVIVLVLLFTSETYGEVPVLLLTFVVALVLNQGTNFLMGRISFVSNSVTSILQLALSIDYAIIFCNRFKEEHRLLALREAANLVYLAKDAQKQGEMEAMAGVIAASFGVPAAMPVVKMALAVCWAFAESILDLRELLDGGKVALFKTAESWQLSLEQLPKLLETGDQSRKNAPGGMEYSDYLRLLLMQKSGKAVTFGAMDLVEYNMRTEQQQPGFRLDCCVDELEAGFTAVIGKREYEITRNYGYEMQGAA